VSDNILRCQSFDEKRGSPCNQPLGTLSDDGGRGRQVTTLDEIKVTSLREGGFYLHCPACGKGYFWNQSVSVDVTVVEKMLAAAHLLGWKFIRFSWKQK